MFSMLEAAKEAGTSKASIWRAIKSGRLSATKRDDGTYAIDPAELFRVYPKRLADSGLKQTETPHETGETAETEGVTAAKAALEVEVRMLREMMQRMEEAHHREREALQGERDAWKAQTQHLLTDQRPSPTGWRAWLKR
ncbi:DNA-binding protein [Microvirga mediterraneensis]|uniref:DNA-binding protein n=1 Tax=Microvirga mediterraneensis TaxID=2754695 RepID=A0A838BVY2_9HYPH|nr:DNA-binding protein [Microvirga mediterraneensis]MBA1159430.1 DNA-binding protein [Microvirga mediterraneensis]